MSDDYVQMKIGLSLSGCVAQICRGLVSIDEIFVVVSSAAPETEEDWATLVSDYQRTYWRGYEEQAAEVVSRLRADALIVMPRLSGKPIPLVSAGIWVDVPAMPVVVPDRSTSFGL